MLFSTWQYALFLPIVLTFYYTLSRRYQNYFLLVASYFFYGCWSRRFLLLLMFSTCTDYFCALGIEKGSPRRRELLLGLALLVNFTILVFFKYFNFFIDSSAQVLGLLGLHPHMPILRMLLPVGVSFYTFQSVSYVVDVYRGKQKAERNFPLYALFVSYFPQLVAGPIERAGHMLPQYRQPRVVDQEKLRSGLMLILLGLFKKLAIADAVSDDVEMAFTYSATAHFPQLLSGAWLFALQIYCDFSGYTDIARGSSRLLGIELMENFNQPYFSHNITEFWRRWHISLSSWLRDYLYIPLGGNRHGRFATYRNLFITMLLGGLWHGANWTYVIWGALHGVYLMIHKFFMELRNPPSAPGEKPAAPPAKRWDMPGILSMVLTFHCVLLAWVFFRAPSLGGAWSYLAGLFSLRGGLEGSAGYIQRVAFFVFLILLIDVPQYWKKDHTVILRWPWVARGAMFATMVLLIVLLAPNHDTPFIYFQF